MDKNWVVGSIVAGIAMFVLNFILGAMGVDFLSATMEASLGWQSILGHLLTGSVLAMVLGWNGASDAGGAGKAGATFGGLLGLAGSFSGMMGFDVMALIGAVVTGAIVYGVSGAVMTMVPSGGGD